MRALVWAILLARALPAPAQGLLGGGQEGLPAPAFRVTPVNGESVSLDSLVEPNGAVVAFADPRSREGQRLLLYLEQSQVRLAEMKVGVVLFAINFSVRNTVADLVEENKLTLPVAFDQGHRVADQYGVDTGAAAHLVLPDRTIFRRVDPSEETPDIGPQLMAAVREMQQHLADERAAEAEAGALGPEPEVAAKPTDREVRERIATGWKLIQQGYCEPAVEGARTLLTDCGAGDLRAALWLAYCLESARQYPEAAVQYRKVLRLRPGHVYALEAIARIDPNGRWLSDDDLGPAPEPAPEAPAP